jgi:hypothetical protein
MCNAFVLDAVQDQRFRFAPGLHAIGKVIDTGAWAKEYTRMADLFNDLMQW